MVTKKNVGYWCHLADHYSNHDHVTIKIIHPALFHILEYSINYRVAHAWCYMQCSMYQCEGLARETSINMVHVITCKYTKYNLKV